MDKLAEEYHKAEEEYEYIKEVSEDPAFDIEKLKQEISVLEDILSELHEDGENTLAPEVVF